MIQRITFFILLIRNLGHKPPMNLLQGDHYPQLETLAYDLPEACSRASPLESGSEANQTNPGTWVRAYHFVQLTYSLMVYCNVF